MKWKSVKCSNWVSVVVMVDWVNCFCGIFNDGDIVFFFYSK